MRRNHGRVRNTILLIVFVLLLTAAALLYTFSEPLYGMQRAAAIAEVLTVFSEGTGGVDIIADAYPVTGEEAADVSLTAEAELLCGAEAVREPVTPEGRATLELYGVLAIPGLEMRLPLYRTAGTVALRFGAGAVNLDAAGVTVIFGYRTHTRGRLLHDVDSLSAGDGVTLTRVDRVRAAYTVAAVRLLDRSALASELSAPPEGCTVAVVSNHPAGETGGRIVVWLVPV